MSAIAIAGILVLLAGISGPPGAEAASSWSPTLLANTEAFQVIDDTDSTANVYIQFGATLAKKLTYDRTETTFKFNDNLEVIGTASGRELHAQDILTSSGRFIAEGNSWIHGTLSGNTISGFNLTDCQGTSNKLVYNSSAQRFECAADQTGAGGGATFGTGSLQTFFDNRFVNTSGDTMTGALLIHTTNDATKTADAGIQLEVSGTASGRALHAQNQLTSSGILVIRSTAKIASGSVTIVPAANQTGAYVYGSGASILALDSYQNNKATQTGSTMHLLFGYLNVFDTAIYRSGSTNSGGIIVQTKQAKAGNAFRIIDNYTTTNNTVFRVQTDGNVFADGTFTGGGADFAEWFPTADPGMTPGDISCLDPKRPGHVKRCNSPDLTIVGITSTKPGFIGNSLQNIEGQPALIGLIGQLPIKVKGQVAIGDAIRLSDTDAVGTAKQGDGPAVCIAMTAHDGGEVGTVTCLLAIHAGAQEHLTFGKEAEEKLAEYTLRLNNMSDRLTKLEQSTPQSADNGSTLAIAKGAIDVTGAFHFIAAPKDENGIVAVINGGKTNQIAVLKAADKSTVTVRRTQKIMLTKGDCILDNPDATLVLMKVSDDTWTEISRSR